MYRNFKGPFLRGFYQGFYGLLVSEWNDSTWRHAGGGKIPAERRPDSSPGASVGTAPAREAWPGRFEEELFDFWPREFRPVQRLGLGELRLLGNTGRRELRRLVRKSQMR